jgi:hypothetical protein
MLSEIVNFQSGFVSKWVKGGGMKKFERLWPQAEFQVLLCVLFFLLLSWPFSPFSGGHALRVVFFYLFGVWGLMILVLFLLSRYVEEWFTDGAGEDGEGPTDV